MIKIVLISLFVTLSSSCSGPKSTVRSNIITEQCECSAVDPEVGTVRQALEANEENWFINNPACARQAEQLNKHN